MKKLSEALKTPNGDPALELWDRFSVPGEDRATPSKLTNPLLAQLMVSSSPRPGKDGGAAHGESSLRRAFSCGTHWPKRRKLDRSGQDSTVTSQGSPRGDSKSAMVSDLLESVTGEINRSGSMTERSKVSTSPSPQKKRQAMEGQGRASPAKGPTALRPVSFTETDRTVDDGSFTNERASVHTSSSDYGADDFDDDTLLGLDAGMPICTDDDPTLLPEVHPVPDDIGGPGPGSTTLDDTFDEVDDELFDVAEVMLAEATQVASQTTDQAHEHGGGSKCVVREEEDDPYGDAFGGDFDFEAVELAATQQANRARSSLPPVCTVR